MTTLRLEAETARRSIVPVICRFFGIAIRMYYSDHPPPHFHARYGEHEAVVSVHDPRVTEGSLPPRVQGMVIEWAVRNRQALLDDWARARRGAPLLPIPPLE